MDQEIHQEPKAEHWKFKDDNDMLSLLIGDQYGETPDQELQQIKADKIAAAEFYIREQRLKSSFVGLEIGSGIGLLSGTVASKVRQLYCVDISADFIELARENCKNHHNIIFQKTNNADLSFLDERSLDFAFAHNVFIHLNIYEIFEYFKELSRVLKKNASLMFDIVDSEKIDFTSEKFLEMKDLYFRFSHKPNLLYNYNSIESIVAIAFHFGFKLRRKVFCFNSSVYLGFYKFTN